jgi:hypothetical protein
MVADFGCGGFGAHAPTARPLATHAATATCASSGSLRSPHLRCAEAPFADQVIDQQLRAEPTWRFTKAATPTGR